MKTQICSQSNSISIKPTLTHVSTILCVFFNLQNFFLIIPWPVTEKSFLEDILPAFSSQPISIESGNILGTEDIGVNRSPHTCLLQDYNFIQVIDNNTLTITK